RGLAAHGVRVFPLITPSKFKEGAGKTGCPSHPWSACNKKSTRQNHRYEPEQPAFPAQWCYGLYVLSPVTGLCCHRRLRDAEHRRTLSASLGAPGPHDFAVRDMSFVS